MNLMKRMLAMLLMLCMIVPMAAVAEDDFADTIVIDGEEAHSGEEDVYIPEEDEELVAAAEILDEERDDSVDPDELYLNENLPDNVINILLVGIDGRTEDMDDKNSTQRGDVQIIVSLNKDTGSIKMTSVMRDLYVKIPGYKSKNRINLSYSRGGGELAMATLNNLLELNIQHYVAINFYGLASIIDSLGGIDIELTKAEANAINEYIRKNLKKGGYDNQDEDYERQPLEKKNGVQHLDGIQAVMYARLRTSSKGDNDFKRSERQRHLLELMLDKVLDGGVSLSKIYKLVRACLPYAKTDMGIFDMGGLAWDVLTSGVLDKLGEGGPLLEQFRIPMDGTYKYPSEGTQYTMFRTEARRQENVEAVHKFIYGEYIPAK